MATLKYGICEKTIKLYITETSKPNTYLEFECQQAHTTFTETKKIKITFAGEILTRSTENGDEFFDTSYLKKREWKHLNMSSACSK